MCLAFYSVTVKRAALSVACAVIASEKAGRQKMSYTYLCNILIAATQRKCREVTNKAALNCIKERWLDRHKASSEVLSVT